MAKDFRIINTDEVYRTKPLEKASATVIRPWTFVTLDGAWLAIAAVAASTAVAYTEAWAGAWELTVLAVTNSDVVYSGTGDAVFAEAQRGTEVDLVISTTQFIDVGASTTDVFKILPSTDAGTVDSVDGIRITVNKSIF